MPTDIIHFGAISVRVVGSGNFIPTFFGYDSVDSEVLNPLIMSATSKKELFRLANFQAQRGMLKLETIAINETFKVNNITIFIKPLWTNYPA